MMRLRLIRALAAIGVVLCLCFAIWARSHASRAEADATAALAARALVAEQVRELGRLRAEQALVEARPRPEPDLIARLESQLQQAGIPPRSMAQVNSAAPAPLGRGEEYRRRTVGVTIEGVSPEQAARFLMAWREAEPLWTVRSVRLQYNTRSAGGGESAFTCYLTLENIHLSQAREESS